MAFGETGELLLQSAKQLLNGSDLVAQIQAHIEQDLVVTAAGGMQLAAQGADLLGQPPLDRHVDVFVHRQEEETSLLQLALHALQPSGDFLTLSAGEDLLLDQHAAMGHATADVIQGQTFIER